MAKSYRHAIQESCFWHWLLWCNAISITVISSGEIVKHSHINCRIFRTVRLPRPRCWWRVLNTLTRLENSDYSVSDPRASHCVQSLKRSGSWLSVLHIYRRYSVEQSHTTNLFTVPLQRTNYLKRASAMEVLISGPTCPVILRETKSLNQFEKAAKSSFWQSQMESSCGNIFFTSIIIENDHWGMYHICT